MASTQNLQATLKWALPFINYQPMTIAGPEPALSSANIVLQTILGPPFCWRWNRSTSSFACTADGTQDYAKALPDFGFAEKAWVGLDGERADIKEIKVINVLAATKEKARPHSLAAQSDDGAGNVTFRLLPAPDQAYTANVLYQRKPPLMTSLASTWAPVPDEYAYIYQWGFLALAAMLNDDPRFPIYNQKFMSHLLGAQDGLDELQRNIFIGNWLEITKSAERASLRARQAVAAGAQ